MTDIAVCTCYDPKRRVFIGHNNLATCNHCRRPLPFTAQADTPVKKFLETHCRATWAHLQSHTERSTLQFLIKLAESYLEERAPLPCTHCDGTGKSTKHGKVTNRAS